MKYFICLAVLISSTVLAQILPDSGNQITPKVEDNTNPLPDLNIKPSTVTESAYKRKVIDLLAIPHKGENFLATNYDYSSSTTNRSGEDEIRRTSHQLNIGAERAILENLSLGAQVGYLLSDTTYVGSENLGNSKGLTDPILGFTYRALDVSRDRFDLNLSPYFSPAIQDATSSTGSKDGNGGRGYSYLGMTAGLGRRNGPDSWAFTIDFFQTMEGSYKDAESGEEINTSSWRGIGFFYEYMSAFTKSFSLKGEAGVSFVGGVEYENEIGEKSHTNSRSIFSLSGTGYFEFSPDNFLSASLGWSGATDAGYSASSDGTDSINTNTSRLNLVLGYLTQF